MGKHRQLSHTDRLRIEAGIRAGLDKRELAEFVGVHISTIYRELKKGVYKALKGDWTEELRYSPEIAQKSADEAQSRKGAALKIGKDIALANWLENKMLDDKYSPEAALAEIRRQGLKFSVTLCARTIYSYIDRGLFLYLSNEDLPLKGKRRRQYRSIRRHRRAPAGESIEHRPANITARQEIGHWEMDSVVGGKNKGAALLVLSERATRYELVFKLTEHTPAAVVGVIDQLERKWGTRFSTVFKTITVDNGSEFAYCKQIEESRLQPGKKRTKMYYCHPYSSYERGTNEVGNRLIRRHFPKGTCFDARAPAEIQRVEDWINNYPRRMFGYRTAYELFSEFLSQLNM